MKQFLYAHASQQDLEPLLDYCLVQLGDIPTEATLGFIYISDHFADQFAEIIHRLKTETGIEHWAGSVAMGVIAGNHEYYNQPAIAIMLADINEADFRLLPNQTQKSNLLNSKLESWCNTNQFTSGLIHGDPAHHDFQALLLHLGEQIPNAFLIGGISSSHQMHYQLADNIYYGGISGVLFSDQVPLMSNLTQGCLPIGNRHRITHAEQNIAYTLDHRPALEVLSEDVGHIIHHDWSNASGLIFAGLLQPHSDINDYAVRQIIGLDLNDKFFALADHIETDDEILFCSRDAESALEDMRRMLLQLKSRLKTAPKGGIYISCMGRGPQQFKEPSQETALIRDILGEFPLIGFFANGEIHKNTLYGFTGVLCLFN